MFNILIAAPLSTYSTVQILLFYLDLYKITNEPLHFPWDFAINDNNMYK
jgi:hypothetical protein